MPPFQGWGCVLGAEPGAALVPRLPQATLGRAVGPPVWLIHHQGRHRVFGRVKRVRRRKFRRRCHPARHHGDRRQRQYARDPEQHRHSRRRPWQPRGRRFQRATLGQHPRHRHQHHGPGAVSRTTSASTTFCSARWPWCWSPSRPPSGPPPSFPFTVEISAATLRLSDAPVRAPSASIRRLRRDGRAVYCTGLENRRRRKASVGSNPTPSANRPFGVGSVLQSAIFPLRLSRDASGGIGANLFSS